MENPDNLLELCQFIFIARENNELALEEQLYGDLIYIFASNAAMIAWTKAKQPVTSEALCRFASSIPEDSLSRNLSRILEALMNSEINTSIEEVKNLNISLQLIKYTF